MFTEEDEKKLAHYGVLGMKWGKRRARSSSSSSVGGASNTKVRMSDSELEAVGKANRQHFTTGQLSVLSNKHIGIMKNIGYVGDNKTASRSSRNDGTISKSKIAIYDFGDGDHLAVNSKKRALEYSHASDTYKDMGSLDSYLNTLYDATLSHEDTSAYLAHYGVLGMKWGKRRGSIGRRSKGSAASKMTDEELKTKIARLSLEATYTKLASSTKTQTRGQALASSVLKNLKTSATKGVNSQVNPIIEKAVANATATVIAKVKAKP